MQKFVYHQDQKVDLDAFREDKEYWQSLYTFYKARIIDVEGRPFISNHIVMPESDE